MKFDRFSYFATIEEITLSRGRAWAQIKVSDRVGIILSNTSNADVTISVERAAPPPGLQPFIEVERITIPAGETLNVVYDEPAVALWRIRTPTLLPAGVTLSGTISGGGA